MARAGVSRDLAAMLEFDNAGVRMPRVRRRKGDGRRQRLRRMAGETRRDEVWRLRHASFEVAEGESVAIVGGRNSGRESLLRLAAGTLIPDEGRVARRMPVVPMIELAKSLRPTLTIRQNIYVVGGLLGMTPDEIVEKLGGIVAFSGVDGILDKYLRDAPSTTRQRLAWSIAMSTDARAYAIEQVLIVGQREFRQACWTRVDRKREDGVTFLLASDSLKQFKRFCDRAILLEDGAVVAETSVTEAVARLRESRRRSSRPGGDEGEPDGAATTDPPGPAQ